MCISFSLPSHPDNSCPMRSPPAPLRRDHPLLPEGAAERGQQGRVHLLPGAGREGGWADFRLIVLYMCTATYRRDSPGAGREGRLHVIEHKQVHTVSVAFVCAAWCLHVAWGPAEGVGRAGCTAGMWHVPTLAHVFRVFRLQVRAGLGRLKPNWSHPALLPLLCCDSSYPCPSPVSPAGARGAGPPGPLLLQAGRRHGGLDRGARASGLRERGMRALAWSPVSRCMPRRGGSDCAVSLLLLRLLCRSLVWQAVCLVTNLDALSSLPYSRACSAGRSSTPRREAARGRLPIS